MAVLDRAQTHASLKSYLIEEAYETLAAWMRTTPISSATNWATMLLEVLLHVQLAEEAGEFRLEDVVHRIASKLVRRHPHVFGDERATRPRT